MGAINACSWSCKRALKMHTEIKRGFLGIALNIMPQKVVLPSRAMSSQPRKKVLISQSEDIHTNLALEDWLYEKADLDKENILLLWRNEPAIVIGRHQNPWLECNVPEARKQGVSLVRRKSGGGTVYHDKGNLNCSVLTNRKAYNRKGNLEQIVKAIQSKWDIPLTVNSRDDIMMDGLYKISGTAAKLGGKRAYHHFTILFGAELSRIPDLLHSPMIGGDTKATASVPAPVRNLNEADDRVNFDSLTSAIAHEYLDQMEPKYIRYLMPAETEFPGIDLKLQELQDPTWTFGKTPKFSIVRDFVLTTSSRNPSYLGSVGLKIRVSIDKGRISEIAFNPSGKLDTHAQSALQIFKDFLTGRTLHSHVIEECILELDTSTACLSDSEKRLTLLMLDCVRKLFNFC